MEMFFFGLFLWKQNPWSLNYTRLLKNAAYSCIPHYIGNVIAGELIFQNLL